MAISIFPKFQILAIFFLFLSLWFIPSTTHLQSDEEGFISVLISSKGLEFAKNFLIEKALSSMIPLQLSDFEKKVKIPAIGQVQILLSDITLYSFEIASSDVETGEGDIVFVAKDAAGNLSMNWAYSYRPRFVPIAISDDGDALVQVEGIKVEIAVTLKDRDGTLRVSPLHCQCHVKDISIEMDGGASWLYQGVVDAFQWKIVSAVEDAVCKKVREGIDKLDLLLQSVPKQKRIDNIASLNITFVNNPVLSSSSIELEIDGLFTTNKQIMFSEYYNEGSRRSGFCNHLPRMVEFSLQENVFNSAAFVYFNVITASCSPEIRPDNLAGTIKLIDFTASLKWSKIGDLQIHLLEMVMSKLLKTIFFPYVNLRLMKGFPLSLPYGFTLQHVKILCDNSRVMICSDVSFKEQYDLSQLSMSTSLI
ncbi:putative BPI/LBP family protein At3g20270 isoform X2 [Carica papaya]|uniref:putative BPI/LBP family protein At3g20270 isoform X2 n=1 Tax=Carica papaya TaxID=3649 RepID=UPI000B8CFB61|nr:putative BPI/LBP family protein At3g20270 isoform X2 [Carica papaya]